MRRDGHEADAVAGLEPARRVGGRIEQLQRRNTQPFLEYLGRVAGVRPWNAAADIAMMADDDGDGRFYYTGMAQAVLLDRLLLDWKTHAFEEEVWPGVPDDLNPFLADGELRPLRGGGEPFELWGTRQ